MSVDTTKKTYFSRSLEANEEQLKKMIGVDPSFDAGIRDFVFLNTRVKVFFVNGLVDSMLASQLFTTLLDINSGVKSPKGTMQQIINQLSSQSVEMVDTLESAAVKVMSGLVVLIVEGEMRAIAVDVRSYPGRGPSEPDTEKVVRGSRDGFTENIIVNTALIRRRIRDDRLRFPIMQVGERSKTDICLAYIDGVANPLLVQKVTDRLKEIDIDGLSMADKTVEEFILDQGYNPFPLVRYTERPDVCAAHILEGHVAIIVDTSPSVIMTPTTYFHHIQHAEEYRQVPLVGTFLRWVRYIGILLSLFILPIWLCYVVDPSLLSESFAYVGPEEVNNIPIAIQILLAEVGVEFLRMAAIHTPTALSTAMGLVSGILIGQIAIDVGIFVPEVVMYVAISAIGAFATPSYELSLANKIIKIFLILCVTFFHETGFVVSTTLVLLYLVRIKSLGTPYFWPLLPFNWGALKQVLIRPPMPNSKERPSAIHPTDNMEQPEK
ncbi:MAG: spore germination protein [Bacilli bacterium]